MNHFSQRYPKIPAYTLPTASTLGVGIAFDLMTVTLHDLPAVPHLLPALQLMFTDEDGDDEEGDDADATKKRKKGPVSTNRSSGQSGRQQSKRAKTETQ